MPGPRAPGRRRRARGARRARRERLAARARASRRDTRLRGARRRAGARQPRRARWPRAVPASPAQRVHPPDQHVPLHDRDRDGYVRGRLAAGSYGHARLHRAGPRDRRPGQPGQLDRAPARTTVAARDDRVRAPRRGRHQRDEHRPGSVRGLRAHRGRSARSHLQGRRVAGGPGRRHRGRAAPPGRGVPVLGRRRQGRATTTGGGRGSGGTRSRSSTRSWAGSPACCRGTPSWS